MKLGAKSYIVIFLVIFSLTHWEDKEIYIFSVRIQIIIHTETGRGIIGYQSFKILLFEYSCLRWVIAKLLDKELLNLV